MHSEMSYQLPESVSISYTSMLPSYCTVPLHESLARIDCILCPQGYDGSRANGSTSVEAANDLDLVCVGQVTLLI